MASILLVEDDGIIRGNICKFLQRHDHVVYEAASFWRAMQILGKSSCFCELCKDSPKEIQLVLTDMELPNLQGELEIFGEHIIKVARKKLPQAVVIAMSGNDEMRSAALKAGCDLFLLKPFRLRDDFINSITQLLSSSQQSRVAAFTSA